MKPATLTLEKQLSNERTMRAEVERQLMADVDRLLLERDQARGELGAVRFRQKARAWFRMGGGR